MAEKATTTKTTEKTAAKKADIAGKVVIEDDVIAKVIGTAIREVAGVYDLGGSIARMAGSVREMVGNTDLTQGVSVEVGEREVAADITLVTEYPHPLQEVANGVREATAKAISDLIGMEIAEINVNIKDVHFPSDDADEKAAEKSEKKEDSRVK